MKNFFDLEISDQKLVWSKLKSTSKVTNHCLTGIGHFKNRINRLIAKYFRKKSSCVSINLLFVRSICYTQLDLKIFLTI